MTQIVVVGAGIGGVPAAYAIKNQLGARGRVTVVSDKDYFEFVPSNPWVALGWRRFNDIAFPIGPYLAERGIEFVPKALLSLHPDDNEIELVDGSRLGYDFLILTTGPASAFDDIPGLDPAQGHCQSVIRIEQAVKAHDAYQAFCAQPGPLVVGAMPSASILGPMYELAFLADADLRRRNMRGRVPITIVTPEPYVGHLGLGNQESTRDLLENALNAAGIDYLCNAKTTQIGADKIQLIQYDDLGREQQVRQLPAAYSVYWPRFHGIAPLRNGGALSNAEGQVIVDEYLRNPAHPNIFAAGLCAAQEPIEPTPVPIAAPKSVYLIQQEVDTAVKNILATIKGNRLTSIEPQRAHWIADIGETGAVRLLQPHVPLRDINFLKQGRWVHSAKIEFEKYFINRIKLKPARPTRSPESEIATVVAALKAARIEPAPKAPEPLKGLQKELAVSLPQACFDELRAMAKAVNRDANSLAGELLAAALQDAKAYLSEAFLEKMERTRVELEKAELPEKQPGIEFHGGAP